MRSAAELLTVSMMGSVEGSDAAASRPLSALRAQLRVSLDPAQRYRERFETREGVEEGEEGQLNPASLAGLSNLACVAACRRVGCK